MFALLMRLAVLLIPLLVGMIALIPARAYDDGVIAPFFAQVITDCADDLGCFFAVREGGLPLSDALDVLRDHPWITNVRLSRGMAMDTGMLTWDWTGAQPTYVVPNSVGEMWVERGRIAYIEVNTYFTLGEVWLHQPPQRGVVIRMGTSDPRMVQRLTYAKLLIYSESPCPLTPRDYWGSRVSIRISAPASSARTQQFAPGGERIPPLWGGCG